jgi:uncharacterized protein (TIGR02453 family)
MDEDFPPPAFEGFPDDAFAFFEELSANQDKEWFAGNKPRYQRAVLAPLAALVAGVSNRLAEEGLPLRGDPKRAVFRINRDVRFSANKAPYKTHAGAVLTRDGVKQAMGVLYLHLDPAGSFCAAGFYHPEPPMLQAMRTRLVENPSGWAAVEEKLADHALTMSREDALVRAPKGFEAAPEEVEAALKLKSWIVSRDLSRAAMGKPELVEALVGMARDAEPLLRFGWSALDRLGPVARSARR